MRIFLVVLLVSLLNVFNFGQETLSLEEAIKIALNRNTILLQNKNNIDAFESNVQASYGKLLPSIGAGGGWQWRRVDTEGEFTDFVGGIPTTFDTTIVEDTRSYNVGVSSQWVLFDGLANWATISQRKNDLKAAEFTLERIKQDIIFQVISLYYEVVNNQMLLSFSEDDLKWNQKNLETIEERNRLGAVTLADVYAQQVRVGNAELAILQTKNLLETAKGNLLYFLGLNVLDNYTLTDTAIANSDQGIDIDADYENLSELVNQALNFRPDYKSALLSLESAYDGVTIARAGHFPTLSNSMSFGTSANTVNDLFKSKSYSVGLTLNIPIFSGFSVSSSVEVAQVQAKNSELEVKDLERDIKRNIQQTYLNLEAAQKSLEVSKRNVTAAEETRKIEQEKYNLGAGTLLNVLIANAEYTNAQTNYINSQFQYVVLSNQLKYYLGTLDYQKYE